jgi:murein L,D-transpeptidase YcbB/YkuD
MNELSHDTEPAAAAALDPAAMMQALAQQNPTLAWLAQMLQAQRQQASAPSEPAGEPVLVDHDEELQELREALAHSQQRAGKLERIARRLAADLEVANARLADLASAFGACGLCWGDDHHCPSCRGRGKPGRFAPDPELRQRLFAKPSSAPAASRTSTPTDPNTGLT